MVGSSTSVRPSQQLCVCGHFTVGSQSRSRDRCLMERALMRACSRDNFEGLLEVAGKWKILRSCSLRSFLSSFHMQCLIFLSEEKGKLERLVSSTLGASVFGLWSMKMKVKKSSSVLWSFHKKGKTNGKAGCSSLEFHAWEAQHRKQVESAWRDVLNQGTQIATVFLYDFWGFGVGRSGYYPWELSTVQDQHPRSSNRKEADKSSKIA